MANRPSTDEGIHSNPARPASKSAPINVTAKPVEPEPQPMPFAYIAREEVIKFAGTFTDPATGRRLTPAQRVLYAIAYLCIPTSGPEAQKPENERVVTEARSSFAKRSWYSERTVTRAYPALERAGLIRFEKGGRAGPANVHTREWQRFTLPKAPRGVWRTIVPKAVRKQRKREQREAKRKQQELLDLLERLPQVSSRIGLLTETAGQTIAAQVAKIIGATDAGTISDTETESHPLPQPPYGGIGGEGSATPRKQGTGGGPPVIPPAERSNTNAGAVPRESPPASRVDNTNDAAERFARSASSLLEAFAKRRRRPKREPPDPNRT